MSLLKQAAGSYLASFPHVKTQPEVRDLEEDPYRNMLMSLSRRITYKGLAISNKANY